MRCTLGKHKQSWYDEKIVGKSGKTGAKVRKTEKGLRNIRDA